MRVDISFLPALATAFLLAVLAQLAIAFNELYDVRISGSRYDRAGRFVESAGSGLFLTLLAVVLVHVWGLKRVLDFPPLTLSQRVQGLPRHLGQHTGGIVIAAGRLDEIVPIEPAAMTGRRIVQWDKEDCADLGIVKVDLHYTLTGEIPRDRVERAIQLSREKFCSVWHSMRPDIELTTSFEVVPSLAPVAAR